MKMMVLLKGSLAKLRFTFDNQRENDNVDVNEDNILDIHV